MLNQSEELSERELEILRLVATGASNKEIANCLSISSNTVKVHLRNIFIKIGVSSRTEAAMYMVNSGLMPGSSKEMLANLDGNVEISGINATTQAQIGQASWILRLTKRLKANPGILGLLALLLIVILGLVVYFWRLSTDKTSLSTALESDRWQNLAAMPTARSGLAAVVFQDRVYAIGGTTDTGITGVVELYDQKANLWKTLATKPNAVAYTNAAVIGGRIFVPGGQLPSGQATDLLEIYDPLLDVWTKGAPLPQPMYAYASIPYEGKLYVFGGSDGNEYLGSVYAYDPVDDTWVLKTSMPNGRAFAGIALSGDNIYIIGGNIYGSPLRNNDIYKPILDNGNGNPWSTGTPLPSGRYGMGVASIADIIYVIGGANQENEPLPGIQLIPATNEWLPFIVPFKYEWSHMAVLPFGQNLLLLGGILNGRYVNNQISYQAVYTLSLPIIR